MWMSLCVFKDGTELRYINQMAVKIAVKIDTFGDGGALVFLKGRGRRKNIDR